MSGDQVYSISNLIVNLTVSVLGVTAVPFIVKKIGLTNIEKYKSWATTAAEAAEKMYQKHTGDDKSNLKKDYVISFLKKTFKGKLTDDQITALLESAVYKLDNFITESKTITEPNKEIEK